MIYSNIDIYYLFWTTYFKNFIFFFLNRTKRIYDYDEYNAVTKYKIFGQIVLTMTDNQCAFIPRNCKVNFFQKVFNYIRIIIVLFLLKNTIKSVSSPL